MKSALAKVLIALIAIDVVLGVLTTPAGGMDPRPPSGATGITWVAVGLFMAGLLTNLAAIVQLVRGKPVAATLALVGPLLFFPVIISDRAGAFHTLTAPPAIATLEWSVAALSVVVVVVAGTLRSQVRSKPSA